MYCDFVLILSLAAVTSCKVSFSLCLDALGDQGMRPEDYLCCVSWVDVVVDMNTVTCSWRGFVCGLYIEHCHLQLVWLSVWFVH